MSCRHSGAVIVLNSQREPSLSDLWVRLICHIKISVYLGQNLLGDPRGPRLKPIEEDDLELRVACVEIVSVVWRAARPTESNVLVCKVFKVHCTFSCEVQNAISNFGVGASLLDP